MNVAHLPELKKFHHITVTKFLRKVFQVEKHGLQSFQFLRLFCKICGAEGQIKPKAGLARHRFSQKMSKRHVTYVRNYSSRQKKRILGLFGTILPLGVPLHPQILADHLTLSQPGGHTGAKCGKVNQYLKQYA